MNSFLKKIKIFLGFFITLLVVFIALTVILNYNHPTDYPAVIKNKYEALDSLSNKNKIIICGGSSSSYSINSQLLEEKLNKPVVNTSLAMDLGSKFHINMIQDYVKEGDVVLYIPEFEFYYGKEEGEEFLYTTAFYYPKMIKDFTLKQKANAISKSAYLSLKYLMNSIIEGKSLTSKQYNRKAFNSYGDNFSLVSINKSKIKFDEKNRYQKLKSTKLSQKFITFLKQKEIEFNNKGVKFIMSYPPVEQSQFDKRFIKDIDSVKKKTKIIFIGSIKDNVYKSDLFYDSSYHLNGVGRSIRTEKLIKNLSKELN